MKLIQYSLILCISIFDVVYTFAPPHRRLRTRTLAGRISLSTSNDNYNGGINEYAQQFHHDSSSSLQIMTQRIQQIEKIQGTWWTSEKKDQLVEIHSSYAIFDSPNPNAPAIMYPLGGTDSIVTLRTCKLVSTTPIPQWSSSPTSKVHNRDGGGVLSVPNISVWEKCSNPAQYWKSNRQKIIPGYEVALVNLMSGGPLWSASPVDVVRASIKCFQECADKTKDRDAHSHSDAAFETLLSICKCQKSIDLGLSHFTLTTSSSWSIIKCQYYSPDVCILYVRISDNKGEGEQQDHLFSFCLSRENRQSISRNGHEDEHTHPSFYSSKLPPSLQYDTPMDIELCVQGKVWMLDHIRRACI